MQLGRVELLAESLHCRGIGEGQPRRLGRRVGDAGERGCGLKPDGAVVDRGLEPIEARDPTGNCDTRGLARRGDTEGLAIVVVDGRIAERVGQADCSASIASWPKRRSRRVSSAASVRSAWSSSSMVDIAASMNAGSMVSPMSGSGVGVLSGSDLSQTVILAVILAANWRLGLEAPRHRRGAP